MKKTVNLDAMIVRDDFKADDTAIPVSYTHLDVYKRQGGGTGGTDKTIKAPSPRGYACLLYTSTPYQNM